MFLDHHDPFIRLPGHTSLTGSSHSFNSFCYVAYAPSNYSHENILYNVTLHKLCYGTEPTVWMVLALKELCLIFCVTISYCDFVPCMGGHEAI